MIHLLAQHDSGWIEGVIWAVLIGAGVLSQLGSGIIKYFKERDEKKRRANQPTPPPPLSRPPKRQVAPPRPPVGRPRPARPMGRPAQPPARPRTQLPQDLPEGLREILGEVIPELVPPRKPAPPRRPAPSAPPPQRPASQRPASPPPQARPRQVAPERPIRPVTSSIHVDEPRIAELKSSLDDEGAKVAAQVQSSIGDLRHPLADVAQAVAHPSYSPAQVALRQAIVMNEILMPPVALRPDDDRLSIW